MGVTYVAIAAEHPVAQAVAASNNEVQAFVEQCRQGKVAEAELSTMEKLGCATGLNALHPITGQLVPVWIANFVLIEYGSGAVMSVPAHDKRDWEFAKKYRLPLKQVITPLDGNTCDVSEAAFCEHGQLINSAAWDGLSSKQAFAAIAEHVETAKQGERRVNYRLRDWGISRQRYWGCPIPVIYCDDCGAVPVTE